MCFKRVFPSKHVLSEMSKRKLDEVTGKKKVQKMPKKTRMVSIPKRVLQDLQEREIKYYDTLTGDTSLIYASNTQSLGTVYSLIPLIFAPSQGDDINQRTARKCSVHSIKIHCEVRSGTVTGTGGIGKTSMVFWLIRDQQCNSTASSGGAALTANGPLSFMNPAYFGRFKILKKFKLDLNQDEQWNAITTTTFGLSPFNKLFDINHTFKVPDVVHFNANTTSAIGSIQDVNYFLVGCDSNDQDAGNQYTFNALSRVAYADLG